MTDEKLIEEAAKAIRCTGEVAGSADAQLIARAALAVFEKAQSQAKQNDANDLASAPTDDEREVLQAAIEASPAFQEYAGGRLADAILAAGFRRSAVPQGEPSDARAETAQAELRQERAKVRGLGFALEGTQAECDRLHKAITEALATAPKLGELRWRNVDRMIGILRAALDKEGKN